MSPRRLDAVVLLVSSVGLAYELALVRVFSIAQWHHLAHMAISMAMLGFAASGTVLGLLRSRTAGRETALLRVCCGLVPLVVVACYEAGQLVPFETYQLLVRPRQFLYLFVLYLVLALPFFVVSTTIALALLLAPAGVGRVYAASLLGSGLGAALAVGALAVVAPAELPYLLALLAVPAFVIASSDARRELTAGLVVLAGATVVVVARGPRPIRISEYKPLAYALRLPDARLEARASGPIAELTAVSSELLRETPGQISNYPMGERGDLPDQVVLFFDAGSPSPVHRFDGSLEPFAFLDHVTSALPYRLLERPRVLVIGAGGGTEVLSALWHGAREVTAVEVDRNVFRLLRGKLRGFSGALYERPEVRPVAAEGRGWVEAHEGEFDLIQISLLDTFAASAAGVHALSESYLYTVEAVALFLRRLSPHGVLAVTRWLGNPPRDAVKLFATLVEGCERAGIADPGRHLAFIRSWNTATLLASRAPLSEERIAAIREFAESRWFDRDWHPGLEEAETNRYTVLPEPVGYRAATAILSPQRERFYDEFAFHVRPATDDRPYFSRFVRLSTLPALVRQLGPDWVSFVEWGYVLLIATVAQAAVAGALLVLGPLALWGAGPTPPGGGAATGVRAPAVTLFGALGVGFMFLEIAFIQRFLLLLHHPVYAVGVVLVAFLVFSGVGSAHAHRRRERPGRSVGAAAAGIVAASLLYLLLLPPLFRALAAWPEAGRVAASLALLAPLAFLMGIPFPTALQRVSDRHPALVPWAWGINGAASVVGVTLAPLLAVHGGFRSVIVAAALLYGVAAAGFAWLDARPATRA